MDVPECPGCRLRDAKIAELEARILALEAQLRDLLDKLKPPPAPRPVTPTSPSPAKTPTGKKRGAQPGHPPKMKTLLPPERVTNVVPFVPTHCRTCQKQLPTEPSPNDPAPTRHQQAELPPVLAEITEYQGHSRTCACGVVTTVTIPADIRAVHVGPRLTAAMAFMAGAQNQSQRDIETFVETVLGVPIALGSVANLQQEMSDALAVVHQEAKNAVAAASVKHVDETGWKQAGKKRWLWAAATATVVAFLIHPRRNLTALKDFLGQTLTGILCSDRWRVYNHWPLDRRQVCWAHLKRNWEKLVERGGTSKEIGEKCLKVKDRVFELWHTFRGGGITRKELDKRMAPLSEELGDILRDGESRRDRRLVRFCGNLLDIYPALWLFATQEGVEPTNNHGERVQRRAVIWRRRSFGCQSAAGCRFVERILTAVETLRLQKRNVVEFLRESLVAHRAGLAGPRLVQAAG
jgi:transposase